MSSYLELLNLTRAPFSNSPDPDAYSRTPTHEDCLNRLEIAIRLRRGLHVVLGEVGTGKSTLCRCLLRSLNEQSGIDVFLLLDAGFEDADEFVRHLCELFAGPVSYTHLDVYKRQVSGYGLAVDGVIYAAGLALAVFGCKKRLSRLGGDI